ncbi:gluconolactonase [Paenibacillus crassostreae]|uniref:Gluconolactonase n=2 Tax=Paenibacillus crassostreae TaxID=1763538 RepID=A0A167GUK1_9BACL|nr:gluconolactonase [Paenibacillus crassostreae]OAB77922.1 gluconolactonase [Paenibacillus crassostreae]
MIAVVSLIVFSPKTTSAASAPYESYNYNYWEEAVPSPAPYVPIRSISGTDLGIGDFVEPSDMYVADSGVVYILDSGNHRIVCLDAKLNVIRIIDSFEVEGVKNVFNNPSGIFANNEGNIYIADTDNQRIVVLSPDGDYINIIKEPKSDILPDDFTFVPLKLTVDKANRVYVVSRGVFEGIVQFDDKGKFIGYVGTNKIERNVVDYFWRLVSTKAQKQQMELFIPTEFSNVDIDYKGFVYATNIDPDSKEPIKRLNPSGEDVLKRIGYFDVMGDIRYSIFGGNAGPSKFIDIKVREGGMYSALDSLRGRIFTYDDEGNLLYIFGAKGTQLGTFKTPVAIEFLNETLVVLDRGKSNIILYEPTLFGSSVNEAVRHHYEGEDSEAVNSWKQVLQLNSNYDIAYIGIGKSLVMEKKNEEALEYFEAGMDRKHYSVAYKRHRREVMKDVLGPFLSLLMVLILGIVIYKLWKKRKTRRAERREAGFH